MSLDSALAYPRRPGFGRCGREIQLLTNFFRVRSIPTKDVYHYDVQITPSGLPKQVNRMVMGHLYDTFADEIFGTVRPAYDGEASFYMPHELPFKSRTETFKLEERRDEFTVKIEHARVVSMDPLRAFISAEQRIDVPLECLQALDVVLKTTPAVTCTMVGASFFSGRDTAPLCGGAEIWKGYYQCLRASHGRLLVNLDAAAACFFVSQPLLKLIGSELGAHDIGRLGVNDRRRIESVAKGLKIEVTHRGKLRRKYRLAGIANTSADSQTFQLEAEDGSQTTTNVTAYFRDRYKLDLQYPHLPLAKVGSAKKTTFLPLEVCQVVGGERISKKLSPAQTSAMIKTTAEKPHLRIQTLEKKVRERDYANDPLAKAFGIDIEPNLLEVKGRVLPPPRILFNENSVVEPNMGSWQMINRQLYSSTPLQSWGVLILDQRTRDRDVENFVRVLSRTASDAGFQINERPYIMMSSDGGRQISSIQDDIMRAVDATERQFNSRAQLMMVVLANTDSKIYAEVKRVCDTVIDVPSQCMLSKHVAKKSPMYCRNIILKMNVKLGGVNSVIDVAPSTQFLLSKPAIVFGADVSHGSPGSTLPSFASLVASMDAYPYRFETQVRAQGARQEVIADLQIMARELLLQFYRSTQKKPEKILFYRDGVSEGQFDKVLQYELGALRAACKSLEEDYTPTVTFVVCAKRHHVRVFPKNRSDSDRSGNVPPGTVVDTDIVHPRQFDFYLVSHSGILGTSRPCHYHCLWDENKFTPDMLQEFTYRQCYLFARCQRAVSLVPAAYYAHLAAFRARHHSKADEWDSPSSSDTSSMAFSVPVVKGRNSGVMYFM